MEAIAALSLASNVIQVLDFSIRFTKKCIRIYTSQTHITADLEALEYDAIEIARLNDLLKDSTHTLEDTSSLPTDLAALQDIAKKCYDESSALLFKVDKIKSNCGGSWHKAIIQTFRNYRGEHDIKAISSRLATYRMLLDTQILVELRSRVTTYIPDSLTRIDELRRKVASLNEVVEENNELLKSYQQSFNYLENSTTEILQQQYGLSDKVSQLSVDIRTQLSPVTTEISRPRNILYKDIQELSQNGSGGGGASLVIRDKLDSDETGAKLRNTLWFAEIEKRQNEIPEAHKETFRWIYEHGSDGSQQWDAFVPWLEGSFANIYWLRGKAGSGKSTLMSYVIDEHRTTAALRRWSGGHELVILKHFFWNPGSELQNLIVGFLRSIIFQILDTLPQLTSKVFFSESENVRIANSHSKEHGKIWTEKQLQRALRTLLELNPSIRGNICLFIDGLDESKDETKDIIHLIYNISEFQAVKLCVSSRPIVQYMRAFLNYPQLKLEDLTYQDIKLFTQDTLSRNTLTQEYTEENPRFVDDVSELIVEKAEGVFLWVKIAVDSVISGLIVCESEAQLKSNLEELPSDIENLYEHMLNMVISQPKQKLETAIMFQILFLFDEMSTTRKKRKANLTDLTLAKHFAFASVNGASPPLQGQLSKLKRNETVRFVHLGAGFIEINEASSSIEFYHKTAFDFLSRRDIWRKIADPTLNCDFRPYESIFASQIYVFDNLEEEDWTKSTLGLNKTDNFFSDLSYVANYFDRKQYTTPIELLNGMDVMLRNQKQPFVQTSQTWEKLINYIRDPIPQHASFASIDHAGYDVGAPVVIYVDTFDGMAIYLQQKFNDDECAFLMQRKELLKEKGIPAPSVDEHDYNMVAVSIMSLLMSYLLDSRASPSTLKIFTKWAWNKLLGFLQFSIHLGEDAQFMEKTRAVESPLITGMKLMLKEAVEVNQLMSYTIDMGYPRAVDAGFYMRYYTPLWAFGQIFSESACGYHDTMELFQNAGAVSRYRSFYTYRFRKAKTFSEAFED